MPAMGVDASGWCTLSDDETGVVTWQDLFDDTFTATLPSSARCDCSAPTKVPCAEP